VADRARRAVVFVDHTSSPGGAELSLLRYLQQADDDGAAELVVFAPGHLADEARAAGRRVRIVGRGTGLRRRAAIVADLWRALRNSDGLVVANSLTSAMYLALLPKGRRTLVYYLREDLSPEWLRGPRRLLAVGLALPRFDAFLANSTWTASTLPPRLAAKPVRVAYPVSGIDDRAPQPVRTPGAPLRVLSLSRLSEWKGVHVLLEAVQELQRRGLADRVQVSIAGDDVFGPNPYVHRLREAAAALGGRVSFLGHLADVRGALGSHDVLVSCSLLAEPFGQVIPQGLANGLVSIGTAMGGPKEVLTDDVDGLLVPPGDAVALADALERLIADPVLVARLQQEGRRTATRYVDATTVRHLHDTLRELAGPRADEATSSAHSLSSQA
jgi:glycosyltransferase involved in cell wall biosynthesis